MWRDVADANQEAGWLLERVGVRPLRELAAIRVSGDDARSWLNGQITNDLRQSSEGDAVYALAVDVRGKILADLTVLDQGDELAMLVPTNRVAGLLEHFEKHIVMEDVEVTPLEDFVGLTIQGPRAEQVSPSGDLILYPSPRLRTGEHAVPGFDALVVADRADAVLAEWGAQAERAGGGVVSDEGWELARLRVGRPRFGRDFGERELPQEAGLKSLALSFEKGCYLGQEVICMLEDRGQLRRRLVKLEGDAEATPGTPLLVGEEPIGEVTSAVRDPADGRVLALGYVKRAFAETGITVFTAEGPLTVVSPVQ